MVIFSFCFYAENICLYIYLKCVCFLPPGTYNNYSKVFVRKGQHLHYLRSGWLSFPLGFSPIFLVLCTTGNFVLYPGHCDSYIVQTLDSVKILPWSMYVYMYTVLSSHCKFSVACCVGDGWVSVQFSKPLYSVLGLYWAYTSGVNLTWAMIWLLGWLSKPLLGCFGFLAHKDNPGVNPRLMCFIHKMGDHLPELLPLPPPAPLIFQLTKPPFLSSLDQNDLTLPPNSF